MKVASIITDYFIQQNWICSEDGPWFRYGIEKRFATIIVFIPTFLLAIQLSGFFAATAFFFSFFYLRSYTNGFHASSVYLCFFFSVILEVIFLQFLKPQLCRNHFLLWVVCFISLALILLLAPCQHPNMPLTREEVLACRKIVVRRTLILSTLIGFTWILQLRVITYSVITGIAMVAFLLGLAHIISGRKSHE